MNPLSAIFGAGVSMRNALYDRGIFQVNKLARPVVSIGNISVGGSGKTPFVVALGELLKQRGIAFDVLSRGYGRSSTEIAVIDPNGSPAQFGDEPLLIAREVIAGVDRAPVVPDHQIAEPPFVAVDETILGCVGAEIEQQQAPIRDRPADNVRAVRR